MRVSLRADGCATQCATLPVGEVEDYTINIVAAPTAREVSTFTNTDINIYPNPVTNELSIDASKVGEITAIEVLDMAGKQMTSITDLQNWRMTLNVSDWQAGMYIVNVRMMDGQKFHHKVIKQ